MHYSSEQNVPKTLISLAGLRLVKNGRFWLLSGRREIGAEIWELPENTGDLATLNYHQPIRDKLTSEVEVKLELFNTGIENVAKTQKS